MGGHRWSVFFYDANHNKNGAFVPNQQKSHTEIHRVNVALLP